VSAARAARATRATAEWLADLARVSVPAMVVNTLESLLRDPQLEAAPGPAGPAQAGARRAASAAARISSGNE
jgi:crotonobetainyl-CoA:carnitine CoA-transferase CaiB-like acyl-CoA transferase